MCADIFDNPTLKQTVDGTNIAYLRHFKGNDLYEEMDSGTIFILEKGSSVAETTIENGAIVK